jgi:acyl-CoA hydrolase
MSPDKEYRPVNYSKITMTELMIPSYANFGGKIHGGILLGLMDKVAYACAAKHAGGYCVTVSVDEVNFLEPVEVGELVSLHASVNYVGNSSLVVGIRVTSENVATGVRRHTNTSYFTMVAKGDDGKPRMVPGLLLESRDDVRRFIESVRRMGLKSRYASELDNAKTHMSVEEDLHLLQGRRCKLSEDTGLTL